MRAGALEHRAAQRRVGAGVKVDLAVQAGKVALGVAAQCKGAVHGMTLGMKSERLGTRELALHRTLELIGSKRGGQHARLDGRTVHMDGAGAASAFGAAILGGMDMQVVAQIAQQQFVLGCRALDAVNGKSEFLCHGDSLLHAGGDAGAIVDGAMRADDGAHAARQAVHTVDMGAVVLDADCAGRALFGAHAATDAARVADLAGNGALIGVVAAHQNVLVAGDEGNHALRARHAAQATARAL